MSGNAEIVRAGFDAFNRGELNEWLAYAHPDIVFYPAGIFPDFPGVFRGRRGMREFWERIREPWDTLIATVNSAEEDGEFVTIALTWDATSENAPPVTLSLITVFRLRDGLTLGVATASSADEARGRLLSLDSHIAD